MLGAVNNLSGFDMSQSNYDLKTLNLYLIVLLQKMYKI